MLSIGEVSKKTGLKVPTIRFYEQERLIGTPPRTQSGRRLYSDNDVRRLTFVRHARSLGFELSDIRSLLDLADHPDRPCGDANSIATRNLETVRHRLEQLRALEIELSRMIVSCSGRAASECRIIESLNDHGLCAHDHA